MQREARAEDALSRGAVADPSEMEQISKVDTKTVPCVQLLCTAAPLLAPAARRMNVTT